MFKTVKGLKLTLLGGKDREKVQGVLALISSSLSLEQNMPGITALFTRYLIVLGFVV